MFVIAALVVMAGVVFLDVVHRTFSGNESKAVGATVQMASYVGWKIAPGSSSYETLTQWLPFVLWPAFICLGAFAIHGSKLRKPLSLPAMFGVSTVGVGAAYGLAVGLVAAFPNGVIWAQPLALILTLWVGFIAASMCAHDNKHLKIEAVQKFVPDTVRPKLMMVSSLFTAGICGIIAWLSLRIVVQSHAQYVLTEGSGAIIEGLGAPAYLCYLGLPIAFTTMTARFVLRAVNAARGEMPPENTIDIGPTMEPELPPSEVPTQAVRAQRPLEDDPSLTDDHYHYSSNGDSARPQSRVPTDPHKGLRKDEEAGQ